MKRRAVHPRQHLYPVRRGTLSLAARCPECGTPPPARISATDREFAQSQAPDEFKQSVQCPKCRLIYELTAAAYQDAQGAAAPTHP